MESDGAAPMLMPQANDGVDFAFASQQIIAASAQMFAAPQQNFQKTLAGLLGMIEQQQKQIKRLQGETDSLKDEMGEMAPRLDGLDNQVDKIAEQVKTLEFNLSGDDDADQGAEPEKEKPPAMDNAIYERLAALETKEEKLQERERLMEKQAREEVERLRAEKADADARAEKLAQEALEAANAEKARALAELERMKLEVEASRAEAEAAEQKAGEASTLASATQAEAAQKLELERAESQAKVAAAEAELQAKIAAAEAESQAKIAAAEEAAEAAARAKIAAAEEAAEAAAQAKVAAAEEAAREAEALRASSVDPTAEGNKSGETTASTPGAAAQAAATEPKDTVKPPQGDDSGTLSGPPSKPSPAIPGGGGLGGGLLRKKLKQKSVGLAFMADMNKRRQTSIVNLAAQRVTDPKLKLGYRLEKLEDSAEKWNAQAEATQAGTLALSKLRALDDAEFVNALRGFLVQELSTMKVSSQQSEEQEAVMSKVAADYEALRESSDAQLASQAEELKRAAADIVTLRDALARKVSHDEFVRLVGDGDVPQQNDGDSSNPPAVTKLVAPIAPKFRELREQIANLQLQKADRTVLADTEARTSTLARDLRQADQYLHDMLPELQNADEELRRMCAEAEERAVRADSVAKEGVGAAHQMESSLTELMDREREKGHKIDTTAQLADAHDRELAKLARSLEDKTSENTVHGIVEALLQDASIKPDGGGGGATSDLLAMMVEQLKLDLRNKTSRADVLRLSASLMEQMTQQMMHQMVPPDNVMAGTQPLRCISCGQQPMGGMHKEVAERVVHDGISNVGLLGPVAPVKKVHANRGNQLIMATYPNGRAGALRPLQPQGAPRSLQVPQGTGQYLGPPRQGQRLANR